MTAEPALERTHSWKIEKSAGASKAHAKALTTELEKYNNNKCIPDFDHHHDDWCKRHWALGQAGSRLAQVELEALRLGRLGRERP